MGRFVGTVVRDDWENLDRRVCRWTMTVLTILMLTVLGFEARASDEELQVVESSETGVRFSLAGLAATWQPVVVREDGYTLYRVDLPGFTTAGPIGGPEVPVQGGWLLVPPGSRPQLRVISESWESAGGRALMITPTPVVQRDSEGLDTGVTNILVLPGETIPAGYDVPVEARAALAKRGGAVRSTAVTLGEIGWWRGHRVVPFRMDKSAGGQDVPSAQAQKRSSRNDDRFGGTFLNAELLAQTMTEAAYYNLDQPIAGKALAARGQKTGTLLGPETRLAVTKTKMHRVTYESLRARGYLPAVPIQESEIRLYQRRYLSGLDDGGSGAPYAEIEVPIHMVGEGDAFDGDDFFVFYGLRLRDDTEFTTDLGAGPVVVPGSGDPFEQNNEANFYWLAASVPPSGSTWARMSILTLPPASGTPLASYRRTEHVEEQEAFRDNSDLVGIDRLYYNNFRASEAIASVNPLYSPDPDGRPAEIRIGLIGWDATPRSLHFDLLGGSADIPLEDYTITEWRSEVVRTHTVAAAALDGNSARVSMTSNNVGLDWVVAYLNWVEISYDGLYRATNNRLDFNLGDGAGPRPIQVTGFADSDLGLYEISDPRQPALVQLAAGNVLADGNTWTLSVMPDQTSGQPRKFFAVGKAGSNGIEEYVTFLSSAVPDPADPLETGGQDPDLIVITHSEFADAIGRWVDHRVARSGGRLHVHVVNVQDVFDWYSGGLVDAWAIKRFVNHAITRWDSWALMIVGDANENVLGKEVLSRARAWSRDWVPTHYHVQRASSFAPELMASDKWYTALQAGADYPNDSFPHDVNTPWDMYTGRFPCNSVADLNNMIDKVIAVENVQAGQDWRKRGIFFADDEWSNGLGVLALSELTFKWGEKVFGDSDRDSLAAMWAARTAVPLDSVVVLLKPYMDAGFPYPPVEWPDVPDPRDLGDARAYAAAAAVDPLITVFNAGGLVCHYQGHANPYLLASEVWLEDSRESFGRHDIDRLANNDKPWFFMGMGCHIADWAQNAVRSDQKANESSISEKMLVRGRSGASATYASSGFEFIIANRVFGEFIFRRWVDNPPISRSVGVGDGGSVPLRSRWLTGELMWAAEADIRASFGNSYPYSDMISQYVLLGDPLMMLDAGEAQVTATLLGPPDQDLSGEVDLVAVDATNQRTIELVARDEAGIDRLEVIDSAGTDLTSGIVTETLPEGARSYQTVNYSLDVPVLPYDHSLTVRVFDTGGSLPSDRHYELVLNMPQEADFVVGGEVIDPESWVFQAGIPTAFTARVTSSAQLDDSMAMTLTSETLVLSNIVFDFNKGRELDIGFTAEAQTTNPDETHKVVLTIDGLATELVMQTGAGKIPVAGIGRVFNYPNPMRDDTRFVFESDAGGGHGVIRVFSVAGRNVARIDFDCGGSGRSTVPWDGRDSRGDELGNGTYLYRVELDTASGPLVSDMQRLVVMR